MTREELDAWKAQHLATLKASVGATVKMRVVFIMGERMSDRERARYRARGRLLKVNRSRAIVDFGELGKRSVRCECLDIVLPATEERAS